MQIVDIRERSAPISRYADPALPSGGLTTSIAAVLTDVTREGKPITGYGFSSMGRFAQSGLIRERFAPRLLAVKGELDPMRAWDVMMQGEKPGGHGERCVAVGTLDMALWDAAAKIADLPLYVFLAQRLSRSPVNPQSLVRYAAGGYRYPYDDIPLLSDELRVYRDMGFTRFKIKIGSAPLEEDERRVHAAIAVVGGGEQLAVDAMNAYDSLQALSAAKRFAACNLWWFEDICDPLDFQTLADVAAIYDHPLAAGEALFSLAEARLLYRYGGLRPQRDVLVFDPVHCYGIPGYARIVEYFEHNGWSRKAFWPHGGHIFTQHVVLALGLGGAEVNPRSFAPFGADVHVSDAPGIGFETQSGLIALMRTLL